MIVKDVSRLQEDSLSLLDTSDDVCVGVFGCDLLCSLLRCDDGESHAHVEGLVDLGVGDSS